MSKWDRFPNPDCKECGGSGHAKGLGHGPDCDTCHAWIEAGCPEPTDEPDLINSPPHYTTGEIESIDYIEDQGHGRGFCYGNALKYLARAPHKGTERADLQKAIWYIERLVAQLDGG